MMSRIVANLNENIIHPDSADPYEILAYILQKHYQAQSAPEIIDLVHHLLDMTRDPFVRLKRLCVLADSAIWINEGEHSHRILDEVFSAVPKLPEEYQKVLSHGRLSNRISPYRSGKSKTLS